MKFKEKYNFVGCFEALYYLDDIKDRVFALNCLCNLGNNDTVFAFSVVTIGKSKHRNYFTKKEFTELLSKKFVVLDILPLSPYKVPLIFKVINKVIGLISKKLLLYFNLKVLLKLKGDFFYQHLFVCKKK